MVFPSQLKLTRVGIDRISGGIVPVKKLNCSSRLVKLLSCASSEGMVPISTFDPSLMFCKDGISPKVAGNVPEMRFSFKSKVIKFLSWLISSGRVVVMAHPDMKMFCMLERP